MLQFVGGGAALSVLTQRISVAALSQLKQLAWAIGLQSASYIAVDKLTDYVLGDEEDGLAETALDVLLSMYLARKGGKLFDAAKRVDIRKYSRAKKADFVAGLGGVPWIDPRRLSKTGEMIKRRMRAEVNWLWSESKKTAVLVGRRSGRVYGHLSERGISIPGIKSLGSIPQYAAGAGGMWALDKITALGLDVAAEQILDINHEHLDVDNRDLAVRGPAGDQENAKVSFIRDPDIWLSAFGNDQTPSDVLIDRAIEWFLGRTAQTAMTIIDDVAAEIVVIDNDASNKTTLTFDALDRSEKEKIKSSSGVPTDAELVVRTRYLRGALNEGSSTTSDVSIYNRFKTDDIRRATNYQRNLQRESVESNGGIVVDDTFMDGDKPAVGGLPL